MEGEVPILPIKSRGKDISNAVPSTAPYALRREKIEISILPEKKAQLETDLTKTHNQLKNLLSQPVQDAQAAISQAEKLTLSIHLLHRNLWRKS